MEDGEEPEDSQHQDDEDVDGLGDPFGEDEGMDDSISFLYLGLLCVTFCLPWNQLFALLTSIFVNNTIVTWHT